MENGNVQVHTDFFFAAKKMRNKLGERRVVCLLIVGRFLTYLFEKTSTDHVAK